MKTRGTVIKLDKSFPLVRCAGTKIPVRAEYSAELAKSKTGVTVGDEVVISENWQDHNSVSEKVPDQNFESPCIIEEILPRKTQLTRTDALDRGVLQVMAANFNEVIICEAAYHFNLMRMARELVIANNSQAKVRVFITKCDLIENSELQKIEDDLLLFNVEYIFVDRDHFSKIDGTFLPGQLYVLLGASGVGKSTLINHLCGSAVQKVGEVREKDLKGKHTTVAREIFTTSNNAEVIDMPGVRAVGIQDAEIGLQITFPEIYEKAKLCKFRNCSHAGEPGCAVRNDISEKLLSIWHNLQK